MDTCQLQGLYEVCIGTRDVLPQIQYWSQFGYRIGAIAAFTAAQSKALYGVESALRSVRLQHQDADHGLVRLMEWQMPLNSGLEMTALNSRGNRWTTTMTSDLMGLWNHAESAAAAGHPVKHSQPYWEVIYQKDKTQQPFVETLIGVREMMLLQPLTRQVFFQRFGYSVPNYGCINESSPLRCSQITHAGLVIQDDSKELLQFYDALGLLRSRDDVETSYESSLAGRTFFDLNPGDRFWVTAFDDPRSSVESFQNARSGRLYIIRFPDHQPLADHFERSRPGCLGLSLYTYRTSNIDALLTHLQANGATDIAAHPNEFGEDSISFKSPDGYAWNILG